MKYCFETIRNNYYDFYTSEMFNTIEEAIGAAKHEYNVHLTNIEKKHVDEIHVGDGHSEFDEDCGKIYNYFDGNSVYIDVLVLIKEDEERDLD